MAPDLHAPHNLHDLSRTSNMIFEDMTDFEYRNVALIETARELKAVGVPDVETAMDGLKFLVARNNLRRRWASSFGERTKFIINFVFSKLNQQNLKTSVGIADLAAKDVSSYSDVCPMLTGIFSIAMMTLIFLPGTLISAGHP